MNSLENIALIKGRYECTVPLGYYNFENWNRRTGRQTENTICNTILYTINDVQHSFQLYLLNLDTINKFISL